jgi:hypothetical protein
VDSSRVGELVSNYVLEEAAVGEERDREEGWSS